MSEKRVCNCSGGSDLIWWMLLFWFWWIGGCDLVKDTINDYRASKASEVETAKAEPAGRAKP